MKLEFSRQSFEKYSNIKFHENPSSGSRDFPRGWTDGRTTGMTKLTVAFRNFANAPKNCSTEQNPRCVMPFLKIDRFF
jgi:hypothetical protein